jgi:biopolymer transport protein ExbB/TolQ
MANADAGEKARLLGSGISEAMYATAAGLLVGVAAMVVHTMCVSKTDVIVGKAQRSGLDLMTWIEQSERSKAIG